MVSSILPLRLENISVKKRKHSILKDVSFEISGDGITLIMGPNGSGKTTLLRFLHGLERQSAGELNWNVARAEAQSRQAFVFQTPIMLRRTVMDNLAYPLKLRGENVDQIMQKIETEASSVSLQDMLNRPAKFLSGGEQQKLAIARALIVEPDVLFLDEPTTNLDGRSKREIEEVLLKCVSEGVRIVMTSHDIGQAKRLAREVIFLNHGELVDFVSAEAFFRGEISSQAQAFLTGDILE